MELYGRFLCLLAFMGGIILMLLMFYTVLDVILRYGFNRPFSSSLELTEFAMAAIVFLGIAYCGWTGGHVAVDILERPLENPRLRFIPILLTLISAALFFAIAWLTAQDGIQNSHRISNMVRWPHWPFQMIVALGAATYAVVLLIDVINLIRGKKRDAGAKAMSRGDWIGIAGIAILLILMALRMPIGVAMLLVGIVGFAILNGVQGALAALATYPYAYAAVYDFAVIPLFVLMGNLGSVSGMARDLYSAAYAWIGHWRAGLAHATILACAGFAAVSGSSVASAVTMGKVCLPEMRRYNYAHRLSTGVIAAGGTLGILIPPSTAFVIYGLLTEQSIGRLLLAGILPGILLTGLFMVTVAIWMYFKPEYGPAGPRATWPERKASIFNAGPMMSIVLVSIGGIYVGVFTPSEAAAIGAFLALIVAIWRRSLGGGNLTMILTETVNTTALVFLILIGALVFGPFLALSGLPEKIAQGLAGLDVPRVVILIMVLAVYIVLGTWMEGFSMLVLTLPIVIPIMKALNYDLIWFGVLMVIVLEMGLIDPPVGINVFIVKGLVPDVPMTEIFAGILPFWFAMMVCIAILIMFPQIALLIPNTMIN